jgi:GntR family transcriptional regulator
MYIGKMDAAECCSVGLYIVVQMVKRQKKQTPARRVAPSLTIEAESFVPYYQQIVEQVRALVHSGALQEGATFSSEGEVASALGISKMPVRQAFVKLRAEGLLVIEKGRRPVVGSRHVPWNFQQLRGFSEEMRRRGLTPSTKLLRLERSVADAETARALRLGSRAGVFVLERLRYTDGQPVALVTSYLPASLFPDLQTRDLERTSLYHLFEKVYRRKLSWAEEEIGATLATRKQARALSTSSGAALLYVRETTYDLRRVPIELSHSYLRADRYKAQVVSVRKR